MKTLTLIFLFCGILACCCTTAPHIVEPTSQESRQIDSCEVFLRKLQANMIPIKKGGDFYYSIRDEWAKRSRKNSRLFNVEADFIDYKSCIIGLTLRELRDMIGEPSASESKFPPY